MYSYTYNRQNPTEAEIQQAGAEYAETHCQRCGGFCPSGVLDSGLCSDCELIGKTVQCQWGKYGWQKVRIAHATKNGTFYGQRWIASRDRWSSWKRVKRTGDHWKRVD